MAVNEILKSALELPIDERVMITDLLTNSLNNIDSNIEKSWIDETNRRLDLLNKGDLKTISYEEFFDEN